MSSIERWVADAAAPSANAAGPKPLKP